MYTSVDGLVIRGPRPQPEDFAYLKDTVKTVVSLEGVDENKQEAIDFSPITFFPMTISSWQIYVTGISQEYLAEIVKTVQLADKPVLVHCQHGEDRTGLVVATYRVIANGWTKDVAWTEALKFGYRHLINFGLNKTWRDFNGT